MFSYIVRDPVTTSALLLGRIVGVYAGVLSGSLLHTIHTIHDTNCNNRIKKPDWLYPPRISLLNKRTNQAGSLSAAMDPARRPGDGGWAS